MSAENPDERLAALRLARTEGIGPRTYSALLERFGSASEALDALPRLSQRGGRRAPPRIPSVAEAETEAARTAELGGRLIALGEPDYPNLLSNIDDPPPVLTVLGRAELLHRPTLAIVGARNASLNGRKLAGQLARSLGDAGFVVASGFAKGIDTAAHEGALQTGTVAAMAGGIDVVYPPENQDLYAKVVQQGVAISEQRLGTQTRAQLFPRRNRLIAGLSRGVIVVEAATRSGSLLTARIAAEQGRDVLAVPGSPMDPRARGTNSLLKDGAVLVRHADDVLNEFPDRTAPPPPVTKNTFEHKDSTVSCAHDGASESVRRAVMERISVTPTPVDELLRDCQLPAPDVMMALLELEIAGLISRHPGNRISLT